MQPPDQKPYERKPYESPKIEDLGTLVDLTTGSTSTGADITITGSP